LTPALKNTDVSFARHENAAKGMLTCDGDSDGNE
jgi:hypothetical protein